MFKFAKFVFVINIHVQCIKKIPAIHYNKAIAANDVA